MCEYENLSKSSFDMLVPTIKNERLEWQSDKMNEIDCMKVIYRTVESFYDTKDYPGIDQYILRLKSEGINFQLCTALLMITKDIQSMLTERVSFLQYAKDVAVQEGVPDDVMIDALKGID